VVLREFTVADLHIVHSSDGISKVIAANQSAIADSIQGKIRSGAEAFLAPKIVVCEGATEIGFLKGLDDHHWVASRGKDSFAYLGIALFDARSASTISGIANDLKSLRYEVAVLADSDAPDQFSDADAEALRNVGIPVLKWDQSFSIEERVFADIPWAGVVASFDAAREIWTDVDRLLDQIQSQFGAGFNRDIATWIESQQLRTALGKAAKSSDWFKRQDRSYKWASAIVSYLVDPTIRQTDLIVQLIALRQWMDNA
jgi:hypothetical protein